MALLRGLECNVLESVEVYLLNMDLDKHEPVHISWPTFNSHTAGPSYESAGNGFSVNATSFDDKRSYAS